MDASFSEDLVMKVYIMRGIPGSGKSSWIRRNFHGSLKRDSILREYTDRWVFSTDHYFYLFYKGDDSPDGVYRFDPSRLEDAHKANLASYTRHLIEEAYKDSTRPVFVDNTNTRLFEIVPYYRIAEVFDWQVEIIHCVCDPAIAIARGTHGVPPEKVWEMYKSLEALPNWWNVQYVNTDLKESK